MVTVLVEKREFGTKSSNLQAASATQCETGAVKASRVAACC